MCSLTWIRHTYLVSTLLIGSIATQSPSVLQGADIVPVSVATDLGNRLGDRRLATDATGRFVLFESLQPNLSPGQIDPMDVGTDRFGYECKYIWHPYFCTSTGDYDVYLHDRETDETVLISHVEGVPSQARPAPSKSYWISPDGRRVIYTNFRQMPPGTFSFSEELTLYDRETGTASTIVQGLGHSDAEFSVRTSTDGNRVAFSGELFFPGASPFVDENSAPDLFLYDHQAETLVLVSAAAGTPTTTGDLGSPRSVTAWAPTQPRSFDMDATGSRIVFGSQATNLTDNDVNGARTDIFLYEAATQSLSVVSRSIAGASANVDSGQPSISGDGRRIVFQSLASDLVPDFINANGGTDIFLYEPDTDTMVLVSRSRFAPNLTGDGQSFDPVISEDGSTILFTSNASDLLPGFVDSNGSETDIFRYDVATGTVTLASRSLSAANQGANGESRRARVDTNGGRVLFESQASDLVAGFVDGNGAEHDLFAFDSATASVSLLNRAAGSATTSANQGTGEQLLSETGTSVLFASEATDLIAPMSPAPENRAYAVEIVTASTSIVANSASLYADASSTGDAASFGAGLDETGRFAVFSSPSSNLIDGQIVPGGSRFSVFLYDRETGEISLISRAAGTTTTGVLSGNPRISEDGGAVAFVALGTGLIAGVNDENNAGDVYLFERATDTMHLVSRSANDPSSTANAASSASSQVPSISGDGRFIAYLSEATDLTTGFVNNNTGDDLFLFDRTDGSNTLISASNDAPLESANGRTVRAKISTTGRYVVFQTAGTDIVPGFVSPQPSQIPVANKLLIWDRLGNEYGLVNHDFADALTGTDGSVSCSGMTPDAERVLLSSNAERLVDGFIDGNGPNGSDLYYWDRTSDRNHLVSQSTSGPTVGANANIGRSAISDDGAWIIFDSDATDLIDGFVSGNGTGSNGRDVYVFEVATGTTTLVSRSTRSPLFGGDGRSWAGAVAEDRGRHYVYFTSRATDLVSGVSFPAEYETFGSNVYRYDIAAGTTELLTHGVGNPLESGNVASTLVAVAEGYVLVDSDASNLVLRDHNSERDVFLIGDDLAADLVVQKNDSIDPVPAGTLFDYTIAVENAGLAPATAVGVFDTLPAGLEVVDVPSDPWRCFGDDSAVGCLLRQALAPGASAPPLNLTVRAPSAGGMLTNTATASTAVPEVAPGSNTDFENTTVIEGGLLFADGFESGDTAAWSNTLP